MEHKIICWECELVLTDKNGRHHNSNFDSRLVSFTPKMTVDTAYALCDNCYDQVLNKLGYDRLGNEIPFAKPDLEKFAELIIKDVLSELERERRYYAEPDRYQDIEYYKIRCAAKEEILAELIGTFKIKYGVE